jgi:hypothetical protein
MRRVTVRLTAVDLNRGLGITLGYFTGAVAIGTAVYFAAASWADGGIGSLAFAALTLVIALICAGLVTLVVLGVSWPFAYAVGKALSRVTIWQVQALVYFLLGSLVAASLLEYNFTSGTGTWDPTISLRGGVGWGLAIGMVVAAGISAALGWYQSWRIAELRAAAEPLVAINPVDFPEIYLHSAGKVDLGKVDGRN